MDATGFGFCTDVKMTVIPGNAVTVIREIFWLKSLSNAGGCKITCALSS